MASRVFLILALLSGGVGAKPPALKQADQELQAKINHAIDIGSRWLASRQEASGMFPSSYNGAYPMGPTALCLLALVHSGVAPTSVTVQRGLRYLRSADQGTRYAFKKGPHRKVYSVSLTIMLLSALAREKMLTKPDRGWLIDLTKWLLKQEKGDGWRYPKGGVDNSNTQYAMLALHEAIAAGVHVNPRVFLQPLERLLRTQEKDGKKVPRYHESGGDGVYAAEITEAPGYDRTRGWGYTDRATATGSMTSAGVTSVQIAIDALGSELGTLGPRARQSVRDGLAWLGDRFTVSENPGRGVGFHFYYFYGLERAGVLARRIYMGKHRWYVEGARYLVDRQFDTGQFYMTSPLRRRGRGAVDIVRESFALLFLTRATAGIRAPTTETSALKLSGGNKLGDKDLKDLFVAAFRQLGTMSPDKARLRARQFANLGRRVIRLLLPILLDGDRSRRERAVMVLRAVTGKRMGYDPESKEDAREKSADKWISWYLKNRPHLKLDPTAMRIR